MQDSIQPTKARHHQCHPVDHKYSADLLLPNEGKKTYDGAQISCCLLPQVVDSLTNLRILEYSFDLVCKKGLTLPSSDFCHSLFLLQKCHYCH